MREGLIIMSNFFKNQVFLRFNRIHTPSPTCIVTIKVRVGIMLQNANHGGKNEFKVEMLRVCMYNRKKAMRHKSVFALWILVSIWFW